jgi:hypothetical protein
MARRPIVRKTCCENVPHPDHAGVVGDLVVDEDGHYTLLEYVPPPIDNYRTYSVPHAWAVHYVRRLLEVNLG